MTRKIAKCIQVQGQLVTLSPLHIGGLSNDPTIDLSLAVDGRDRYYIPGTSCAGALRHWFYEHLTSGSPAERRHQVGAIWGYQERDQGHASYLYIEDLYIQNPESSKPEIRDGVGIERRWGVAAEGAKYDRAILPKGTIFDFKLSIDIPAEKSDADQTSLDRLLSALHHSQIRLGAAKTRGLGKVKLEHIQKREQILNSREGMLATLKAIANQDDSGFEPFTPTDEVLDNQQLTISITWEPLGSLMVKDACDGQVVDIVPLMSADGHQLSMVLPGSSIKGALRSQAERIVRTVLARSVEPSFLEQIQLPLINGLFGSAARVMGDKGDYHPGLGALAVDDCYSQQQVEPSQWEQAMQSADASRLKQAFDATSMGGLQQAYHVAIDRWTGGAADSMLYTAIEPFGVNWEPIQLNLNLPRLPANQQSAAQALLLLMLRDLATGRIPLGYGVNRGYGALKVTQVKWGAQAIEFLANGEIQGIALDEFQTAWEQWTASPEEVAA